MIFLFLKPPKMLKLNKGLRYPKCCLKKKYDDKEIECKFCHKIVRPIIKRNIMAIGLGMTPGPFFGRSGSSSAEKPHRFILICPKCKALIGAKK